MSVAGDKHPLQFLPRVGAPPPVGLSKHYSTTAYLLSIYELPHPIQEILTRGTHVLAAASSAVAAQLLDDERTTHSVLMIEIPVYSESICSIKAKSRLADELMCTKRNIWDEIVMTHQHNLEPADRTLKDLLRSLIPFAGIVTLFIGDFTQTTPIVRAANRSQVLSAYLENLGLTFFIQASTTT